MTMRTQLALRADGVAWIETTRVLLVHYCLGVATVSALSATGSAGEVKNLQLDTNGTASAYIFNDQKRVILHDLGQLDPESAGVYDFIVQQVQHKRAQLVISCSHEHGDHGQGFKLLVKSLDILAP